MARPALAKWPGLDLDLQEWGWHRHTPLGTQETQLGGGHCHLVVTLANRRPGDQNWVLQVQYSQHSKPSLVAFPWLHGFQLQGPRRKATFSVCKLLGVTQTLGLLGGNRRGSSRPRERGRV